MYQHFMALVLLIGVIAWLYVTLKINGIFDLMEGFTDSSNTPKNNSNLNSFGIPSLNDLSDTHADGGTDYMKKLQSDLQFLSKETLKSEPKGPHGGIKPVVDTLRDFVMQKAASSPGGKELLKKVPKSALEGYTNLLGQDDIASTAEKITTNPTTQTNKPVSLKGPKCKFMTSYTDSYTCPDKYSSHLGAVFGAKASSGLTCNGKSVQADRAKAYAIVRDGKITKIKVVSGGSNYVNSPRIRIKGAGTGARARATVGSDGTVHSIKVVHPGQGYINSPKIVIAEPDGNLYCHLCCSIPQG